MAFQAMEQVFYSEYCRDMKHGCFHRRSSCPSLLDILTGICEDTKDNALGLNLRPCRRPDCFGDWTPPPAVPTGPILPTMNPNELKDIMHKMNARVFQQYEMCRHWCQMRGCRNLSIRGRRTCRLGHPAYIMGVDTLYGNICHKFLRGTCSRGNGCRHLHMSIGEVSALCTPAELADNWMIDETMTSAPAQRNNVPATAAWLDWPTSTPASSSSTPTPGNLDKMD